MSLSSPAYLAARRLYDNGQLAEARASLQRSLQRSPNDVDLNTLMGGVLVELAQPETAIYFLERAVAGDPANISARSVLGEALMRSHKLEAAEKVFRQVVLADRTAYSNRLNLANILVRKGSLREAQELLREAVALRPDRFDAINNLSLLLTECGRAEEAVGTVRKHIIARPDDPMVSRCLANMLNYLDEDAPGERVGAHRAFGQYLFRRAAKARAALPPFSNSKDPARRLRIAYMSPDLREHSVAYFVSPLFRHHDRSRFEVYAYSNAASTDKKTEQLKPLVDQWRDISRMSDTEAAMLARKDQIDIMIDLAGLTNNHRLSVLALGAAPVQMTYCGYPGTTGLPTVDYRLVDQVTDPPGSESQCVEKLLRIPGPGSFSCYEPPPDMPEPAPWDTSAPVTFGSFNVLSKVTPRVLETWARILQETPRSRLILKARSLNEPSVAEHFSAALAALGISPDRVELYGLLPSLKDHLALYSRIAIGLDPFPYNGTTTTYEAMWMGVPVITLAGVSHAGRVGTSILTALGEPGLIAANLDQYVAKAVALARQPQKISEYRATLRGRLAGSSLCDGPGFTRRLELALTEAWKAHCGA